MPASVPAASRHCFEALPSKYSLHDPWDYPAPWQLSASIMKFISTGFICFASHPCPADQGSAQRLCSKASQCWRLHLSLLPLWLWWNQAGTNLSPLTDSDIFKNQTCNVWNTVFKREKLIYEDKFGGFICSPATGLLQRSSLRGHDLFLQGCRPWALRHGKRRGFPLQSLIAVWFFPVQGEGVGWKICE